MPLTTSVEIPMSLDLSRLKSKHARAIAVIQFERLVDGEAKYGEYNALKDERNMAQERFEEIADWSVYRLFEDFQNALKGGAFEIKEDPQWTRMF